jgi:hypothetical protein
MARRTIAGLLPVDFFTRGYRISGHVSTRTQSVGDMLNDRLTSYLEIENVYIARISSPGDIIATYSQAQLRKDNLLFAIVPGKESLSRATRSVSYFGKQRLPVWISLPTVEIEGELQVAAIKFDLEMFLTQSTGDYLAVLDATARAALYPDVTFGGEAFLVNKHRIDLFCLGEDKSP